MPPNVALHHRTATAIFDLAPVLQPVPLAVDEPACLFHRQAPYCEDNTSTPSAKQQHPAGGSPAVHRHSTLPGIDVAVICSSAHGYILSQLPAPNHVLSALGKPKPAYEFVWLLYPELPRANNWPASALSFGSPVKFPPFPRYDLFPTSALSNGSWWYRRSSSNTTLHLFVQVSDAMQSRPPSDPLCQCLLPLLLASS